MVINSLSQIDKSRYKIVLDNEESFVLYRGELSKLNIREGEPLPEAVYKRIFSEILPKRAKLRGLNLLKSRPYTEREIRKKYQDGGYPDIIIEEAVSYLKELKLINDAEYCRVFLTYKSAGKSRKRMMLDLINKGVKKDVIESVMSELSDNGDMTSEDELIKKYIIKRKYNSETATYEEKMKFRQYLYGKGFDMDSINRLT